MIRATSNQFTQLDLNLPHGFAVLNRRAYPPAYSSPTLNRPTDDCNSLAIDTSCRSDVATC